MAVLARSPADLKETEEALRALGSPDAVGLAVDVADAAGIDGAFATLGERWDALNILVNTVGPGATGTIDQLSEEGWTASFELGTISAVRCVRAALPLLREDEWARIVNV